jgi:phage shock protein E
MSRALTLVLLLAALVAGQASAETPAQAVWIDVRSPAEHAEGHLAGAILIPFDAIEKGVMALELEKDQPIYLYCAVGGRAEIARKRLQSLGYTRVTNVGSLENARARVGSE